MSPLPALFQLTSIAFTPELQRARQEAALKNQEVKAKEVAWTNFPKDLMVGALMGGVAHTIVAPVERAKLLLQTQDSNMVVMDGKHVRYKGLLDCIVRIAKNEGVLSLWRGNISSVLRYYPSLAINFAFKVLILFLCTVCLATMMLRDHKASHYAPLRSNPFCHTLHIDSVQFNEMIYQLFIANV